MKTDSGKKQNKTSNEAQTSGDAINHGLWRLSLVLKEIAESTVTEDATTADNQKSPSGRRRGKAIQSKGGE